MSAFFERVRAALAPKGYDVLRELGSGGMGAVFLARQVALDWLVAIKVLRPELATADGAERFHREARTLASLGHPNIVPIHDYGESRGIYYYVMDYLEGETLADRLAVKPLSQREALKLGRDLLDALGAAHRAGVVHRDVKPANIFLLPGRAVLTDFGVAKRLVGPDEPITVAGALVGTVDYMPPEQLAGKEITAATDLYAAAMVIYEAYTGRHWEITDRPERAVWSGVPRGVAAVLQHALAFAPEGRYPDATAFRRALWHTRERMYQWRTLGLTIAGLVAGAVGAVWLLHRWQEGVWPFRPPGALDVVVAPFESICGPASRSGERVAQTLVRELQGYLDFTAQGPSAPSWFRTRSTVVVRGTVCARGDSLRIAVGTQVGRQATDPTVITAQGETGHLERVADTLAYGLVRDIWNRENPLDLVLPRTALPQTAAGLAAWLAAERLLAQGRWGDADRAYEEAERIDSTCWLCAWRHADVDRWLGRKFDEARAARYLGHIDSFPPHYRRLMRASRRPLLERLEMLISLTHERRDFLPAQFMLADELYHRGPLVGHPRREAIEAFQRVVHLRPDFMPAWEHLVWVLAADGQEAAAKAAYDSLQRSGPPRDPFSEQLRALFQVGLACRFDGSASCRHALDLTLPGAGSYPDLAAGPRYLMTFDAPWGAIEFGRRFAALRDQPELARSGLIAQVSGYVALGLADSARAAARELRGGGPELNVFAPELDGALLLVDADCAEGDARWAELSRALAEHARSRASTDATRRRAAWMLLLLARHCGAHADSAPYVRMVTGESGRRPLAGVLAADALARAGHVDLALAATDPLTTLPADSLGDPVSADPLFRVVLHLLRAGWHERRHDVAGAVAELDWYENNDAWDRPGGPPQVGDMDWAFGTLARWHQAVLLEQAGETGACRAYAAVAGAWAGGDTPFRARADSAAQRVKQLHCGAP